MLTKKFEAEIKADEGELGRGQFEALVAVFDNVDLVGDRIKSGAFDETLAAWRKSGDPIPVVLAHDWSDPWAHIGYARPEDVKAIPGRGLYVEKATLDIDDNPLAAQVHKLMARRTLKEFSFGYRVPEGGERKAQDGAFDLTRLDLIEFGPCLAGVNQETELLGIKAEVEAQVKRERGNDAEPTLLEQFKALNERLDAIEAELGKSTNVAVLRDDGHLVWTHPDIKPEDVPGLNLPDGKTQVELETKEDEHEETVPDPEGKDDEHTVEDDGETIEAKTAEVELMLLNQGLDNQEAHYSFLKRDRTVTDAERKIEAQEQELG